VNEPIRVVLNLPQSAWPAAEPLVARLKELESGATKPATPLTNRQKVRALIRRCEDAGREVRVKDVIAVVDIDESLFYKWQRGDHVSRSLGKRCEDVVALSADHFLSLAMRR
jgi:hypothetical protein